MPNIMINEKCNLRCPYCFASTYVNKDNSKDITLENFAKAVDFCLEDRNGGRIGIIGGEPTVHPQFEELMTYLGERLKDRAVNPETASLPPVSVCVFTNGIFLEKYAEVLGKYKFSILVNVNSPAEIGEKNLAKIKKGIFLAKAKGVEVSVGINLYKPGIDFTFILDILKEFNLADLRVGIDAPTAEQRKAGPIANYMEIKQSFIDLVRDTYNIGVKVSCDCITLPRCIFTQMETEVLQNCGFVFADCKCVPVSDIRQDLTVVRCFGLSSMMKPANIADFDTPQDPNNYFASNIDNLSCFMPVSKHCMDCYLRKTGRCQGGCLAYKFPAIAFVQEKLSDEFGISY